LKNARLPIGKPHISQDAPFPEYECEFEFESEDKQWHSRIGPIGPLRPIGPIRAPPKKMSRATLAIRCNNEPGARTTRGPKN
jgi:hypothetical protein